MIRQGVAFNPSCPGSVLAELAADSDPSVQEVALRRPQLIPSAVLLKVIRAGQPKLLEDLAANKNTPPAILKVLALGDVQTEVMLLALARNPNLASTEQLRLAKVGDRLVRTFLARLPNATPETLSILAQDGDIGVRAYAAQNRKTPAGALESLGKDNHMVVREAVAANRSAPPTVLERLAKDRSAEVRTAVVLTSNGDKAAPLLGSMAKDESTMVRSAVSFNPHTPLPVLKELVADANTRIRAGLAGNPSSDSSILERLTDDKTIVVRQIIALRPDLSEGLFAKLANDSSSLVLQVLAGNDKLPQEVATKLASSTTVTVRAALAGNHLSKVSSAGKGQIFGTLTADREGIVREILAGNVSVDAGRLSKLVRDQDSAVVRSLSLNPSLANADLLYLSQCQDFVVYTNLLGRTDCPTDVLNKLGAEGNICFKYVLAAHANTPDTVLGSLAKTEDPALRTLVAGNPHLNFETIEYLLSVPALTVRLALARSPRLTAGQFEKLALDDPAVKRVIASNPSCPATVLRKLSNEKQPEIRQALASNPATPVDVLASLSSDEEAWVAQPAY